MLSRSAVTIDLPKNTSSLPAEELAQNEIINLDGFERPHYNLKYYDTVPIEDQQQLAKQTSISKCKDLDYALPLLQKAEHVLEIGGGYGRILEYAIAHKLESHFDVIEPTKKFYAHLSQKFYNQIQSQHFTILPSYIEDFHTDKQYDVVLWMWSQINELTKYEILLSFQNLKQALAKEGTIFIDAVGFGKLPEHFKFSQNEYLFADLKYTLFRMTVLSPELLRKLAIQAGFSQITYFDYFLESGIRRSMITLQH